MSEQKGGIGYDRAERGGSAGCGSEEGRDAGVLPGGGAGAALVVFLSAASAGEGSGVFVCLAGGACLGAGVAEAVAVLDGGDDRAAGRAWYTGGTEYAAPFSLACLHRIGGAGPGISAR